MNKTVEKKKSKGTKTARMIIRTKNAFKKVNKAFGVKEFGRFLLEASFIDIHKLNSDRRIHISTFSEIHIMPEYKRRRHTDHK